MPNPAVDLIISSMNDARNGGDYLAIFQGKKLAFKFSSIRETVDDLKESAGEARDELSPVTGALPTPSVMASSGGGTGAAAAAAVQVQNSVIDAVNAVWAAIKEGGARVLQFLKTAFMRLIEVFDALKEALTNALSAVMTALNATLEVIIQLLLDIIPNAFIEFVQGIVAAIVPFLGQLKACGSMLIAVGKLVKKAVERNKLIGSARALDDKNRITNSARSAVIDIITGEVVDAGKTAALKTVNAGASVAGLVFTGNVAGIVAGIATSVAELCIKIVDLLGDVMALRRGNALLETIKNQARKDINPIALFNAAPILGCAYITSATQSSLIANTDFMASMSSGMAPDKFMAAYQKKAAELSPFRTKAASLVRESRLELTANSTLGVVFDFDIKDEIKDQVKGKISDAVMPS
jgi:hypothetical protein